MLIDSGDKDDSNKIEKYLEKQGVTELKYLIATHPHADHIGEMSEIIDQFQVDKFIVRLSFSHQKRIMMILITVPPL